MDIPLRIRNAADTLLSGRRVNRITVRDFLRHFGVERRGAVKVQEIRAILDELDLETEPDFESAWIDAPLLLKLKGANSQAHNTPNIEPGSGTQPSDSEPEIVLGETPLAVQESEEQSESAPTADSADTSASLGQDEGFSTDDPTYRIGSLPAANKKLVTVNQSDQLTTAITLMLQYDVSQLPVMQGEREVKGVLTWKSIGAKHLLGTKCETVADCREDARIVDSNRTLFDTIPMIVEHGYVLVRAADRRITGIVTASDLSLQFQALAEPFLLLREIELHVRRLLSGKVSKDDLAALATPIVSTRRLESLSELTFGEYVRLLQDKMIWKKLGVKVDNVLLTKLLDEVRQIRNDVMHFDPDPMTSDELMTLKRAVRLLQELYDNVP